MDSSRNDTNLNDKKEETKNKDLTPPYHVIELDQARLDVANAYLNEGSPNSIQSQDLKNSMQNDKYFSSQLMNSGSTSREELNTDQVVSN